MAGPSSASRPEQAVARTQARRPVSRYFCSLCLMHSVGEAEGPTKVFDLHGCFSPKDRQRWIDWCP